MTPPTGVSINNRSGEVTVSSKLDYDQDGFVPTILMYIYATDNPDCGNNENYFVMYAGHHNKYCICYYYDLPSL